MMLATTLLLAASVALSSAETVTVFGAGFEDNVVYVSPIASDATATTYLLGCPAYMANNDSCVFPEAVKYTIGPKTVHAISVSAGVTLDNNCQLETSPPSMVCEVHYTGPAAVSEFYFQTTSTITINATNMETLFGTATVVADSASILNAASAFTNDAVASTTGNPPATSGPGITPAPSVTSISSGTDAVETTSSTGGMPQITGSYGWSVGGIAAVAALAVL